MPGLEKQLPGDGRAVGIPSTALPDAIRVPWAAWCGCRGCNGVAEPQTPLMTLPGGWSRQHLSSGPRSKPGAWGGREGHPTAERQEKCKSVF